MSGIMMATFMGQGAVNPFLGLPETISGEEITPGANAVCTLTVSNDGTWSISGNTQNASGTWLDTGEGGVASNYDVYFTIPVQAGDAINTWLNLGTTRSWSRIQSSSGSTELSGWQLKIRQAASPFSVLDTSLVTVRVERT